MIIAAHIGIGIKGLEGTQAARSSDYAIGRFKYLRPLLFYHGREAYRRNSMLAQYMFYKNILYVLPLYWFGFFSAFSGQTLYEAIIYQGYNTVFTAMPIMWYAVFDEEYTKKEFHTNPLLYSIGQNSECYSMKLLVLTLVKGIFHALLITMFVFVSLNGVAITEEGYNGSLWFSGTLLYAIVVIIANMWIFQRTNSHTVVSFILIYGSFMIFFLWWWFENLYPAFPELYGIFDDILGQGKAWLVILLSVWFNYAWDITEGLWSHYKFLKKEQERLSKINEN